jgi:hypothetical protein
MIDADVRDLFLVHLDTHYRDDWERDSVTGELLPPWTPLDREMEEYNYRELIRHLGTAFYEVYRAARENGDLEDYHPVTDVEEFLERLAEERD